MGCLSAILGVYKNVEINTHWKGHKIQIRGDNSKLDICLPKEVTYPFNNEVSALLSRNIMEYVGPVATFYSDGTVSGILDRKITIIKSS